VFRLVREVCGRVNEEATGCGGIPDRNP